MSIRKIFRNEDSLDDFNNRRRTRSDSKYITFSGVAKNTVHDDVKKVLNKKNILNPWIGDPGLQDFSFVFNVRNKEKDVRDALTALNALGERNTWFIRYNDGDHIGNSISIFSPDIPNGLWYSGDMDKIVNFIMPKKRKGEANTAKSYVLAHKGPNDTTYCKNKAGDWTTHIEDAWEGSGPDSFSAEMKRNFADAVHCAVEDLEVVPVEKFESFDFDTPHFNPREYEGEYILYTLYGLDSDGDELEDIITSSKKSTVVHTIKELLPDYRRIYNGMHVVAILYDENHNMLDSVVVWSTDQNEANGEYASDTAWQVRVEFDLNGKREFTHVITHAGSEAEAKKNAAAYVGREYSGSKNIAVTDAKTLPKYKSEKLSYEKGHKNSKGEDAPWVIRSHKDDSVLASFPTKKEAENHMRTMKRYSKTEGKFTEIKAAIKAAWSAAEAKWFRLDFREATERLDVYPIASDNEGVGVNWGVLPERNTIVQYATDLRTGDNQIEREMPYKDLDELEKIFVDEFKSMDETLEVGADNGADIHPLTENRPTESEVDKFLYNALDWASIDDGKNRIILKFVADAGSFDLIGYDGSTRKTLKSGELFSVVDRYRELVEMDQADAIREFEKE